MAKPDWEAIESVPGQIALSVKSELKILSVENICIQIIYEIRPN